MTDQRWRPRFWDALFAACGLLVILADRPKWVIVVYWLIAMAMVAIQARMIEELER